MLVSYFWYYSLSMMALKRGAICNTARFSRGFVAMYKVLRGRLEEPLADKSNKGP